MTTRFWHIFAFAVIAAAIALVALPARAQNCGRSADRPFRVFNGMFFADQPDMRDYGIQPIHIVDRGIWAQGVSRLGPPDAKLVKKYVDSLPDDDAPIVLDFEDFSMEGGAEKASDSVSALSRIARAFDKAAPGRQLGFYGYLPNRDYWRAVEPSFSAKYRSWKSENDRVRALEREVDILFPSLYTFYTDEDGWEKYAEAQICEARRLSSKPVYVFIWPEYHHTEKTVSAGAIPPLYWRRQLETAHRLADGVVIWGGWNFRDNKVARWDASAEWWLETRKFLREVQSRD